MFFQRFGWSTNKELRPELKLKETCACMYIYICKYICLCTYIHWLGAHVIIPIQNPMSFLSMDLLSITLTAAYMSHAVDS